MKEPREILEEIKECMSALLAPFPVLPVGYVSTTQKTEGKVSKEADKHEKELGDVVGG